MLFQDAGPSPERGQHSRSKDWIGQGAQYPEAPLPTSQPSVKVEVAPLYAIRDEEVRFLPAWSWLLRYVLCSVTRYTKEGKTRITACMRRMQALFSASCASNTCDARRFRL